jgi:sugar-phosphatase
MKSLTCKAILFDMDGTLIDSNKASELIWETWSKLYHVSIKKIRAVHHGRRPEETIALVAPHLNAKAAAQMVYDDQDVAVAGIFPIQGANDFYNSVPSSQKGIVTAATLNILKHRFAIVGIQTPEVCVTAEILKNGKPDPEGYLLGASRLGLAPKECIVFEDAPAGLLAAKRAGMRSVAITTHYSEAELKHELGENYEPSLVISNYLALSLEVSSEGSDRILKIIQR